MILLIPPGHGYRAGLKAVMTGQFKQRGVKTNGVTPALQYSTAQIVIKQNPRQRLPGLEGGDMTS
jgi:hypothetical protein